MNRIAPRTVAVQTVGCRLNQYESERIVAQLAPYGFQRAKPGEEASLYIINTCTVTHRADSNCRNLIRRAARTNPNGRIVVIGCYVDAEPELIASLQGVDLVLGNEHKDDIGRILLSEFPEIFESKTPAGCVPVIDEFFEHNRAWIKVSDGCNQACSYCIVTKVRGRLVNRPLAEIIDEINGLVGHGYKEVVLTGVHIGHYAYRKSEPHIKNLASLCRMIFTETDLYRLRISSIEPQTIRDDLLDVYAGMEGRICHHMHVPMQSGSERILKEMRRPYTPAQYLERLEAVKKAAPQSIIGADVIVGFPGETDEDFRLTRQVAESGLIDYLHVFSYSDRKGTLAAGMPGKVRPDVIKERNAILTRVSDDLRERSHHRQLGRVLEVISEHKKNEHGGFWGISGNYIRVKLPGHTEWGRDIVPVRVAGACAEYVEGEVGG
ncbi:MAG: tRNA (N(6)-L-threonylcarbamoyladenosine(37)-C(2))-methylthiotransferase MtaB [Candidatus Zixiibacteriota bacterium]|nr:MAG: tRNA (N(6)-L-threonylcarbamoyladenosine(37)-C(2))-methylthiotransferase MtaB [candidate division Zixibacteria bacterium]